MPKDEPVQSFRGFSSPNFTTVPDELFDDLLAVLSGSELKVLLYISRRTFGFKRDADNISLSQMLNGIVTNNGRVLDHGAGIKDKKTLLAAINKLEERKIILTKRQQSAARGNEPTTYSLNMRNEAQDGKSPPPLGGKPLQGVGGKTPPSPWGGNPAIQETVSQQTDRDLSKFEGSHDKIKKPSEDQGIARQPTQRTVRVNGAAAPASAPAGYASLQELIAQRRKASGMPRRGRPTGSGDERERLRAFLADFALELGDEAPLSSTITRTLNIFTAVVEGAHYMREVGQALSSLPPLSANMCQACRGEVCHAASQARILRQLCRLGLDFPFWSETHRTSKIEIAAPVFAASAVRALVPSVVSI